MILIKAVLIVGLLFAILNYLNDFAIWFFFFGPKVKVGQVYILDYPGSAVEYKVTNVRGGWANLEASYPQFDGTMMTIPVLKTTQVLRQVYKLKKN